MRHFVLLPYIFLTVLAADNPAWKCPAGWTKAPWNRCYRLLHRTYYYRNYTEAKKICEEDLNASLATIPSHNVHVFLRMMSECGNLNRNFRPSFWIDLTRQKGKETKFVW